MGQRFPEVSDRHAAFIAAQKIFFVATATADSRINLSPKGLDSFRLLGPKRALWLNLTGSGNETAVHVREDGRMTVMFCAFDGAPLILRLYGRAQVHHRRDPAWSEVAAPFPAEMLVPGARQIVDLSIELVQSSCGFAVPLFDYVGDRTILTAWAAQKGEDGIADYWRQKNTHTLDGQPTEIAALNLGE